MKILVIIPARCGSKGIPFKNLVDINGKTLIQYTTDVALKLKLNKLIDEAVVSTDCKKILEISKKLGINAPYLRPSDIAGDKAKSIDYILHALEYYENHNINYDAVIVLQPTSPLRTYSDAVSAIRIFLENNRESLISAYKEETINDLIMYHKGKDLAVPLNKNHNEGVRRQDHDAVYIRNGAIYITTTEYIKREKRIISDSPLMYEMSKSGSINIDTFEDLECVRNMLCR